MTSQALLDLEWVLTSTSLVDDPRALGAVPFDASDVDADHLDAFLAARGEHRVGRYFEHLMHYWLAHVRKVDVVEVGMQIIDNDRRTLGEIDFLYRDEQGELTHCEVAVKFFLHYPNDDGSHFPGPAARDNFERKANQLFDVQLELSQQHVPDVTKRVGIVKGRVFHQVGAPEPTGLPHRLNPNCLGGAWVSEKDVANLDTFGDVGFHFVQKPHWFAPLHDAEIVSRADFLAQLSNHFDGPAYPVMLSLRASDGTEVERCFVVPDAWPGN